VKAKAKEDLALAEEKKKEELAQLVLIFTNRETAMDQEISNLRQEEELEATKAKMAKLEERATN